jgi:hypothetical protein
MNNNIENITTLPIQIVLINKANEIMVEQVKELIEKNINPPRLLDTYA